MTHRHDRWRAYRDTAKICESRLTAMIEANRIGSGEAKRPLKTPILKNGNVVISIDPAMHRTGVAWFFGAGSIRAVSIPTHQVRERITQLTADRYISRLTVVVEGSLKHLDGLGVGWVGVLVSRIANETFYVPPEKWQNELFGKRPSYVGTKSASEAFCMVVPEIRWRQKRTRYDDDAADAACLLYWALVVGGLMAGQTVEDW